jgi:hypothetical protein
MQVRLKVQRVYNAIELALVTFDPEYDVYSWNRIVTLEKMFKGKSGFTVWLDESDYRMIERFI